MANAVRYLSRAMLHVSCRTTAKQRSRCPDWRIPSSQFRSFSSAPSWLADDTSANTNVLTTREKEEAYSPANEYLTIEDLDPETRAEFDRSSPEDQHEMREALRILSKHDTPESLSQHLGDVDEFDEREIAQEVDEIDREAPIAFPERKPHRGDVGFWADEEDDEFGQVIDDDDEFLADDITTPAHAQLDLHRDMREYQRRIAWDMPLLRKFAKPFHPPPLTSPLRFRYTTYQGEQHPAAKKVVVEFCPSDLPHLTPPQRNKLIKLSGVRYNPSTQVIKISCEKFETPAQNKRYLGDLVNSLIVEATDPQKDSFEDVPFDFRHHKPKKVLTFPEEWKLGSPAKVRELVDSREKRRLLAQGREVVDGNEILRQYVHAAATFQARVPSPGTMVGAPQGRGAGRQAVRR